MKRFKKLKFDAIALIVLGIMVSGMGASFDLAFITSIGYFAIAMNLIMFIAWRILEEIEENKNTPEFKERISPLIKNAMTAGLDKIIIESKGNGKVILEKGISKEELRKEKSRGIEEMEEALNSSGYVIKKEFYKEVGDIKQEDGNGTLKDFIDLKKFKAIPSVIREIDGIPTYVFYFTYGQGKEFRKGKKEDIITSFLTFDIPKDALEVYKDKK